MAINKQTLKSCTDGTPPCHAQFEDLVQIGFQDEGTIPNRRRLKFNGEMFSEGILEAIIELGREQMTAAMDGCLEREQVASARTEPEDAPGVKTRLRLVS
jgi:hypothetical protein